MSTASREARRRRIVDRGSDRLALITGRIETLPSSSSSLTEPDHSHTPTCPPSISYNHNLPIDSEGVDDNTSNSLLPLHESVSKSGDINADVCGIGDQPVLQKFGTNNEASRATSWEVESRSQSSQVLSPVQESPVFSSDIECRLEPHGHHARFFTPKQISSAVKATESTRTYSSLGVAILVVLSFVGFPILGRHVVKSVVFFRPLYLVLIIDVSIVLSWLLLDKQQRGLERTGQVANKVSSGGGYVLAGKALEFGLVLQKIMGALFMDCSVYAIVLICGLSVAQKLGW